MSAKRPRKVASDAGPTAERLTEAQAIALRYALDLETEHDVAIFPRRGQHRMFSSLARRGLLFFDGHGVDMNDHHIEVALYRLTDAGRELARRTPR